LLRETADNAPYSSAIEVRMPKLETPWEDDEDDDEDTPHRDREPDDDIEEDEDDDEEPLQASCPPK
jgi:hypothetical protein